MSASPLNAKTLSDVATAANYVYRQRFIADKYGLATAEPVAAGSEGMDIVAFVDAELAADGDVVDAEIVEDHQGAGEDGHRP